MGKLSTFKHLWKTNKRGIITALWNNLARTGVFNKMPDVTYLKTAYWMHFGKKLDLNNPKSFNEKLQWLKLHDRNPLYTTLVDKFAVREYIAEKIGAEYLVPQLGVWDDVDEIDFSSLPERFVLKCTHDSGSVCLCNDISTFDVESAKAKLRKGMKSNLYYWGREWPYKDVKPRIIAEQYLGNGDDLPDYKLMCFNGEVRCSFVCSERFEEDGLKVTFFDRDWNVMPFERHYPKSKTRIEKPRCYDQMILFAERLAKDIPFVRVDFYEVDGRLYFGEMTFFPGNGMEEFSPKEADYELGSWLELP